jgi:hypothetical protein
LDIGKFVGKPFGQRFHIVSDFLVIDTGVSLGSLNITMPHHTADTFYWNALRQAQLGSEGMPALMEGNRFINPAMSGDNF